VSRVPPTFKRDPATPPPGTIGIVSGDLGRFTEFAVSMLRLVRPPNTSVMWVKGLDVTDNYNRMVEGMAPESEWFWIMGDDHLFDPLILIQLLAHDVDVVVPFCLERQPPFKPVVYSGIQGQDENGFDVYTVANLPQSGLVEVYAAGTAGMLIRRRVLDALERPVFETSGRHQNEDLNLCRKIRDAGFTIHCDVDARLGHIGVFSIFPLWVGDRFGTALENGGTIIPLYPYDEEEAELEAAEA
jgi:hypothetical protein